MTLMCKCRECPDPHLARHKSGLCAICRRPETSVLLEWLDRRPKEKSR